MACASASPAARAELLLEAPALILGVVQLGEGVGDLVTRHEELEAVDEARVAVVAARERRELERELGDEDRLDEERLHDRFEDRREEMAGGRVRVRRDPAARRQTPQTLAIEHALRRHR